MIASEQFAKLLSCEKKQTLSQQSNFRLRTHKLDWPGIVKKEWPGSADLSNFGGCSCLYLTELRSPSKLVNVDRYRWLDTLSVETDLFITHTLPHQMTTKTDHRKKRTYGYPVCRCSNDPLLDLTSFKSARIKTTCKRNVNLSGSTSSCLPVSRDCALMGSSCLESKEQSRLSK